MATASKTRENKQILKIATFQILSNFLGETLRKYIDFNLCVYTNACTCVRDVVHIAVDQTALKTR